MLRFAAICLVVMLQVANAQVVTAITVPVGGVVHVTIQDVYSDGSTTTVSAANSTWTSTGPNTIANADADAAGTGWNFTGLMQGSTTVIGVDTANNISGPPLAVTVTPTTAPTITKLQYTSP